MSLPTYCGARHCIGVASGTAALTLALDALGVGAGDEVVVPANTFVASALAVVHAGATPVFCDVEQETGLMSPEAAAAVVTPRTAALLPVHLYGQCCDMDSIGELATRHGLAVVEDAAQAHGATHRGRRAGSLGTAAAFSFYPSKNLGALGDGGAVCTSDPDLMRRIRALRDLGQFAKGDHALKGYNERLDGLQAAFLSAKLTHLDDWNAARCRHASTYRELLGDRVEMLTERPATPSVHHIFPIRVGNRDEIGRALAVAGVATGTHYARTVPAQQSFGSRGGFPAAERWAATELSLPMFEHLREDEIEQVARELTARC